jgi:hypothetical protein
MLMVCVESFDKDLEEVVTVSVSGWTLTCFATVCPTDIVAGGVYSASLDLFVIDEYHAVRAAHGETPGFERVGEELTYWVRGVLSGSILDVGGIRFMDETFAQEYGDLDGCLVKAKIDRIDIDFDPSDGGGAPD